MAGRDYVSQELMNAMTSDDWEAIKGFISGDDPYNVTIGDIDIASNSRGFLLPSTRDRVQKAIRAFMNTDKYKTQHAEAKAAKDELDTGKLNKDKMRDLLLSMELGTPQGLAITDPTVKAQFEKMSAPFQFQGNNPYIQAMQRQITQSDVDLRANMAQNLAARGVSGGGGESQRAVAEATTTKGTNMANLQGQDYLRQFGDWRGEQERQLRNIGNAYGVESTEYKDAESTYYDLLKKQAEENAYKASSGWLGKNWGNLAQTAIGGALTAIPGTQAIGIPMLASGLGGMASTTLSPDAVGGVYNRTITGSDKYKPYVPVLPTVPTVK